MITPFGSDGKVDIPASKKIINYLIEYGAVPFIQGTTGEGLSISNEQRLQFGEAVAEECRERTPVFAAISHHSFSDSVMLGRRFLEMGMDAVAAHLPGFYPMADDQIITYYEELAEAVAGPLIIYNIPKTVHRSIPLSVADRLSHHPDICGIKDSENNLSRQVTAIDMWSGRNDFVHVIGWSARSAYAVSRGSDGIVPSTGNIVPGLYRRLYEAASSGDMEEANRLQEETDAISRIYQEEKSLADSLSALKVIMKHLNFCDDHVLPPLTKCSEKEVRKIKSGISSDKHLRSLAQHI